MQNCSTRNGRPAFGLPPRGRRRQRKIDQAVSSLIETLEPRLCLTIASLVQDLNTASAGSSPQNFIQMSNASGAFYYFDATDQAHGDELWRTDGTALGTTMVKDINPGINPSHFSDPIVINGTLYFGAFDPSHGQELWKSDGTTAGTTLVADINPGVNDSNPYALTNVGGNLFFVTDTTDSTGLIHSYALYKYDGTAVTKLKSFEAVPLNSGASDTTRRPDGLTAMGANLIFEAYDSTNGQELWKSDGTSLGTAMISNINSQPRLDDNGNPILTPPDADGVVPGHVAIFDISASLLLFAGNDGTNGTQLWQYNGVTESMLSNINGPDNANPTNFTRVGNSLVYFTADDGVFADGVSLWKTNGTATSVAAGVDVFGQANADPVPLFVDSATSTLYYSAQDITHPVGRSLYKITGTISTSTSTFITTPTITPPPQENINSLVKFTNGLIYFNETDTSGSQLWSTTGAAGNATKVTNSIPLAGGTFATPIGVIGTHLLLTARDATHGIELWATDFPSDSTTLSAISNINTGTDNAFPGQGANVKGTYIFPAAGSATSGMELFKTDGTTVSLIKDITDTGSGGNAEASFQPFDNNAVTSSGLLFFGANDNTGRGNEVWVTDGTAAGTHKIIINNPTTMVPANSPSHGNFLAVGNVCYFTANDGVHGAELWKTDGTAGGTSLVADINPGSASGVGGNNGTLLINIPDSATPNIIYFTADNGVDGNEIWQSDGTISGTNIAVIGGLNPNANNGVLERNTLAVLNKKLYFSGVNGTTAGLFRLDPVTHTFTLVPDPTGKFAQITKESPIVNVNGTLFFFGFDATNGSQLWKSDGSTVSFVHNFTPGFVGSEFDFSNLTASGNLLFFSYNSPTNGTELFRSDGTDAGTFMPKDIFQGASSSVPSSLTDNNGRLYFSADDGINGNELWQSDGTTNGTYLVRDINIGNDGYTPNGSHPQNLASVNGTLFFAANNAQVGDELWKATNDFLGIRSAPTNTVIPTITQATNTVNIPSNSGNSYVAYADLSTLYGNTVNLSMTGGALEFDAVQHLNSLSITGGAASLGTSSGTTVLVTKSLSVTTPATFDINSGGIIVDYSSSSPLVGVRTMLMAGRGANTWQGMGGITSTAAAADPMHFAVGYAENSDLASLSAAGSYTVFAGQTVDSTSVLIRYTRGADANLDGIVNGQDVAIVGTRFGKSGTGQWEMGDFDYSGIVDNPDVDALSALYNPKATPVQFGRAMGLQSAVFAAVPLSTTLVSGVVTSAAKTSTTGNPGGLSSTPKIANGAALDLPGGTYYFNSLTLGDNVRLNFTGPASIYIAGNVVMRNGNNILAFNNDPSNLIIYQNAGSSFTMHDRNTIMARMITPGVAYSMHDSDTILGCLIAGSVSSNRTCTIANLTLDSGISTL